MEHKESVMRNTQPAENLALFELLLKGAHSVLLDVVIAM